MASLKVIADDFTGAAEIAAIAQDHSLTTELFRQPVDAPGIDACVFDTDSRACDEAQAAAIVSRFAVSVLAPATSGALIFKKIDSVLRGPVRAEAESILAATGLCRCLIVPPNPLKGRVIAGGKYRIDGVELPQTAFAADPLHPAITSDVVKLLGERGRLPVKYLEPGENLPAEGIIIGGGSTSAHLQAWARQIDDQTLPVGGAEFFTAFLQSRNWQAKPTVGQIDLSGTCLCVCGSLSGRSRQGDQEILLPMPDEISKTDQWHRQICRCIEMRGRAIVSTPNRLHADPHHIAGKLAEAAAFVVAVCSPKWLLVEGGQTASAIVARLGWTRFSVLGQLGPGVVQLQPKSNDAPGLIVKPGSYPWPQSILTMLAGGPA